MRPWVKCRSDGAQPGGGAWLLNLHLAALAFSENRQIWRGLRRNMPVSGREPEETGMLRWRMARGALHAASW